MWGIRYLFMLFAEAAKKSPDKLDALRVALETNLRLSWKDAPISVDEVVKILGADARLQSSLEIADRMAAMLARSTFVAGNPRIVKRILNAVRMRARVAERREMNIDEGMVAKFALFERCVDPGAVNKLYGLINEAAQGKPQLIADLEASTDDPKRFTGLLPEEWKASAEFLHDWMGLSPALGGTDLRPLVYLSKETAVLRAVSGDLSKTAVDATSILIAAKTLASPAAKMVIATLAQGEHPMVMRELIALLRAHGDWSERPQGLYGAVLLADADTAAAHQLSAMLASLPGSRSPWLTALLKDRSWAKGAV